MNPKPQRVTKKNQPQDQPQTMTQGQQEISHLRQDNYLQGSLIPQNTMTYMSLPNPMQNKICGRCGLVGHIKRMCKEEVYCKYCKVYTHSTTACRTYPATSSRKNTPEKQISEDIEREVSRRVQEEMKRILNDLSTSRRVASTQEISRLNQGLGLKETSSQIHNIPKQGQNVQSLIGNYHRPLEVFENARSSHKAEGSGEQILNQQWDEPPHMQPPMRPTVVSMSQQNPSESRVQTPYTMTNMTSHQIEVPVRGKQGNLAEQRSWDPSSTAREKSSTSATRRQIEIPPNELRENRSMREMTDQMSSMQGSVLTPTRH